MTWSPFLVAIAAAALVAVAFVGVVALQQRRPPDPTLGRRRRAQWAGVARQLLLAAPIRLWALILAGPPLTALLGWGVYLVRYGWAPDRAEQQLGILGLAIYGLIALIAVIIVSLASVKLEAETKLGKLSIGGDHDDDRPAAPEGTP